MAKFSGKVGYVIDRETAPGVYMEEAVEFATRGEFVRNAVSVESGENVNSTIQLQNAVSIVADPFARKHYSAIRYLYWAGEYWSVKNIEIDSPRLILRLGGVYNGPKSLGTP